MVTEEFIVDTGGQVVNWSDQYCDRKIIGRPHKVVIEIIVIVIRSSSQSFVTFTKSVIMKYLLITFLSP